MPELTSDYEERISIKLPDGLFHCGSLGAIIVVTVISCYVTNPVALFTAMGVSLGR